MVFGLIVDKAMWDQSEDILKSLLCSSSSVHTAVAATSTLVTLALTRLTATFWISSLSSSGGFQEQLAAVAFRFRYNQKAADLLWNPKIKKEKKTKEKKKTLSAGS